MSLLATKDLTVRFGGHVAVNGVTCAFQPGTLTRLAPLLLQHGRLSFSSDDVLKFRGQKTTLSGQPHGNFRGELTTDFKRRPSGDRVKYRLNGNSLKGYGKASTPVEGFGRPALGTAFALFPFGEIA